MVIIGESIEERNRRIKIMRNLGYTFRELGETYKISRQRAHQICGSKEKSEQIEIEYNGEIKTLRVRY